MSELNMNVPPQDLEVEKAVLGAILLEKDSLLEVVEYLSVNSFYDNRNRDVYENGILPLFYENAKIDILTVTNRLRREGLLNKNLNPLYVSELTNRVASSANIGTHTLILREMSILRDLIKLSAEVHQEAFQNRADPLALLDSVGRRLDAIGAIFSKKSFHQLDKLIYDNVKKIEALAQQGKDITGVPSGLYDLDRITSGFQRSDNIVVAARPGMGKTALAVTWARNAAVDFKIPVGIFSIEMSASQLVNRLIVNETGLSGAKLKRGNFGGDDWKILNAGIGPLANAPIFIDDSPGLSVFEFKAKSRRLKRENPELGMIIVDYLQLMTGTDPDNKNQSREQQISYISRSIKAVAKELDIPVIAISQLSRSVESRGGDKRPMLSDLRESGAIEQDADIVIFVYRPDYYGMTEDSDGNNIKGQAALIIAKHRNGALGEVKTGFFAERSKFVSLGEFRTGRQ